jgi:hypothetical protein
VLVVSCEDIKEGRVNCVGKKTMLPSSYNVIDSGRGLSGANIKTVTYFLGGLSDVLVWPN